MTQQTFAVLDQAGLIVNRVFVEGDGEFTPPENHTAALDADNAYAIGGTLIGGVYTPPPAPEPLPPPPFNPNIEQQVLYDHENRIRAQEGAPPLDLDEFMKRFSPRTGPPTQG